jgi:hypothetical protein
MERGDSLTANSRKALGGFAVAERHILGLSAVGLG